MGDDERAPVGKVPEQAEQPQPGEVQPSMVEMLPSVSRLRLDVLLQELVDRAGEVMATQGRLRRLLDAVVTVAGDLSLPVVLQRIVEAAVELAGARYGALGVIGPDRSLSQFVTVGIPSDVREQIGSLPAGRGILGLLIDEPEPIRLRQLGEHARSYGFPANHPAMGSFLGVPVRVGGRVFGNLYLTEKQGAEQFTQEDEDLVVALAAAAGVVIQNAELFEETTRRRLWLQASAEITGVLLANSDRHVAFERVVERVREVAGADLAAIVLPNEDDETELVVEVAAGLPDLDLPGQRMPLAGSPVAEVLSSGRPAVVVDASVAESGWLPEQKHLGALMAVPVATAEQPVGVLLIADVPDRGRQFSETDVSMVTAFAGQAALALVFSHAARDRTRLALLEDRDRIARDLHDLVIQRLFAIGLSLETASRLVQRPEVGQRIATAVDDLDATIADIRSTIFGLQSRTATMDLRRQLLEVASESMGPLGFEPRVHFAGPVDSAVPDEVRPHLLAAVREMLSNAARHAGAGQVDVRVEVGGGEAVVRVADDGRGMSGSSRRSGLRNLAERAAQVGGTLTISTGLNGRGTGVELRVPVGTMT